jgi:hypothetical protein
MTENCLEIDGALGCAGYSTRIFGIDSNALLVLVHVLIKNIQVFELSELHILDSPSTSKQFSTISKPN